MLVKRFQNRGGIPLGEQKVIVKKEKEKEKKEEKDEIVGEATYYFMSTWFENRNEDSTYYLGIRENQWITITDVKYQDNTKYTIEANTYSDRMFPLQDNVNTNVFHGNSNINIIIPQLYLTLINKEFDFKELNLILPKGQKDINQCIIYNALYIQALIKAKSVYSNINEIYQLLDGDISKLISIFTEEQLSALKTTNQINVLRDLNTPSLRCTKQEIKSIIELFNAAKLTVDITTHAVNFIHVLDTYNGYCFAPFQEIADLYERAKGIGIELTLFEPIAKYIFIKSGSQTLNYTDYTWNNIIDDIYLNLPKIEYVNFTVPDTYYKPISNIFNAVEGEVKSLDDFIQNYQNKIRYDLKLYLKAVIECVAYTIIGFNYSVVSFDCYVLEEFDKMLCRDYLSSEDEIIKDMEFGPIGFLDFVVESYTNLLNTINARYNGTIKDSLINEFQLIENTIKEQWEKIFIYDGDSSDPQCYKAEYNGTEQEKRNAFWEEFNTSLINIRKSLNTEPEIEYPITEISKFEPNTEKTCYAVIEDENNVYITNEEPTSETNFGTIETNSSIIDFDLREYKIMKNYDMYTQPKDASVNIYTTYDISIIMKAIKHLFKRIGVDEMRCIFKCVFGTQLNIDKRFNQGRGVFFTLIDDINYFNSKVLKFDFDWAVIGFDQSQWMYNQRVISYKTEEYGEYVTQMKTVKVSTGAKAMYTSDTIAPRLLDFLKNIQSCLYTSLDSEERTTALAAYKIFSFVRSYDHYFGYMLAPTQNEYSLEDIYNSNDCKYYSGINNSYTYGIKITDETEEYIGNIPTILAEYVIEEGKEIENITTKTTYNTIKIEIFIETINLQELFNESDPDTILASLEQYEDLWKEYLNTLQVFTEKVNLYTCDKLEELYDTLWFGKDTASGSIEYGLFAFYTEVQKKLKQWCIDNEVDYNEFEDWLDSEGNLSTEKQQVIDKFSLIYSVNEDEGTYSCYPDVEDFTQDRWEQRSAQWRHWLVSLMGFRSLLNYENKASDNDYILDDFTIVQNSNYGGYKINLQTDQNLPMVDERYFFTEEFPIYNNFIFLTYDYLAIMWALHEPEQLLSPELLKCIYYNNYKYAKGIKEPDDFIYRFFWLKKDFFIPKEILGITDPFNLDDQQGVLTEAYPENEEKPWDDIGFYKRDEVNGWFTVSGNWKTYGNEIVELINNHSALYELVKESLYFIRTFNDQYEIRFMGRTGLGYEKVENNYWLPVIHGRTSKEITEFKCLVEKTEFAGNNNDYFISVENKPDSEVFPYEYYFCPVYLDNGEFIFYYPQLTLTDLTIEFNEEMVLPDFEGIKINELSEEDKERARTEYIEGINTITTAIKSKSILIKEELTKLIQETVVTTDLQKCYVYSVDAYPHEEIDKILTNIFGEEFKTRKWEETTDLIVPEGKCGILELEEYIYQYLNIYQTELFELFNVTKLEDIPTGGRIKDGKFVYNSEKFTTFYEKKKAIHIYEEREDELGEPYIVDTYYEGHSGVIQGETQERNKCWGPFTEVIQSRNVEEYIVYGTGFNGQFEVFSDYISTLTTAEEPDIPDNNTTITTIAEAELEIYDKQEIYNVFESSLKDGTIDVIEELTTTLGMTVEEFIRTLLLPGGEIKTFCAYREPEVTEPISADDNDKLIEYSQMFQTIQMEKDALEAEIDDNGEHGYIQYLLAFLQTPKGTIFTLVTPNLAGTNKPTDANETIEGFYLCKGIEKGRYRIVGMTELYEGEPLDWCNDNYYSNFIYDQNMENLNVIIDGEFSSRTTTCNGKEIDQNMVGYYILESKF